MHRPQGPTKEKAMPITQKRKGSIVAVFAAALALFAILASSPEAHADQSG